MESINAIMVGRDVAFKGDLQEFEVARQRLLDLAAKVRQRQHLGSASR